MDNNAWFTVLVGRCVMNINPDAFFNKVTLRDIKHLFGYIFQEPWRNTDTINFLTAYLPQKQADAEGTWESASLAFQENYIVTDLHIELTAKQKRDADAANKKLFNNAKKSKAAFVRWSKILAYFEAIKDKNCI